MYRKLSIALFLRPNNLAAMKYVINRKFLIVHLLRSFYPGTMKYVVNRKLFTVLFPILLLLNGCMDDAAWYGMNDLEIRYDTVLNGQISRQSGLFIVNEGNFMYDNASLSYYMIDSMKLLNDVFYRTNGVPLGDVAQSMVIRDSLGYIVVNNSGKIYIINTRTFEYEGKITGLTSPRQMHFVGQEKAYVTDLYARAITIVNPQTNAITGYIDVSNHASRFNQHATEQMVQIHNEVFVNCWSFDNKILVIDTERDEVTDSIEVPLQPNSMVTDRFGRLWVLCDGGYEGNPAGNEEPALLRIDPATREIEKTIRFPLNDHPSELRINGGGDTLYFLNRHAYRQMVLSAEPPELFIEGVAATGLSGGFYGLGIDPFTGEVYVADAIDQVRRGRVVRYRSDGTPVDTFTTGINPGFFCFRP
jgi:DNA-binding beta-propeller fold protein YncE